MPVVEVGKPRASRRFHAPSGCSNVRNEEVGATKAIHLADEQNELLTSLLCFGTVSG
jgi:hypothetical protein